MLKISLSNTSQKENYSKSFKFTHLKSILGPFTNPNFHKVYLQKHNET